MKRNATEVLRRGFNVTVANWPLIALRIVESLFLFGLVIAAVLAVIVPIVVSAGIGNFRDVASVAEGIVQHAILIIYILLVVAVLLAVMVALHAFVDGGTAQVLVDSERNDAKPSFDMSRFLAGGRRTWWAIFWIYNIVWSIAGLIILLPLTATLAGMVAAPADGPRIVIGCAGLLLSFIVMFPIAIVAGVWTQKSIAVCAARDAGAVDAMRIARQQMAGDFGRHFVVAFIAICVTIGGSGVISLLGMPFSMMQPHHGLMLPVAAPAQIVVSLAQSIFSGAAGAWFLACFIALTEEK